MIHSCCPGRMLFAAVLAVFSLGPVCAQDASKASLPVRPKDLLASLPAAPLDWKLVASKSRHVPQSRPLSRAYREYTYTPPPGNPAPALTVPTTVKINVIDTAGDAHLANLLKASEGASQRIMVASMPARRLEVAGETEHLEVLALERFLLEIIVVGDSKEKAENWVKRINLPDLQRAASQTGSFDPRKNWTLTVEFIDELTPSRNRSTQWGINGEEEFELTP